MKKNILLVVILVIIVGAAGFFAGVKYQQSKQPSRSDFQNRMGTRQDLPGNQRPAGSQMIRGEVISRDQESVTVKLPDESSKIILISENTAINKTTEGSIDDLENGQQVMVFGQQNSDGTVSAANIQIGEGFLKREL